MQEGPLVSVYHREKDDEEIEHRVHESCRDAYMNHTLPNTRCSLDHLAVRDVYKFSLKDDDASQIHTRTESTEGDCEDGISSSGEKTPQQKKSPDIDVAALKAQIAFEETPMFWTPEEHKDSDSEES